MNVAAVQQASGKDGKVAPGSGLDPKDTAPVDHNAFNTQQEIPEYLVMLLIIECLNLHKSNLSVYANLLNGNAAMQSLLEGQIAAIKDTIPRAGAGTGTLQRDQTINEERGNERASLEDVLITGRTRGQVLMSQANNETNNVQQAATIVSFVLKTYLSEGQVIIDMNGNKG